MSISSEPSAGPGDEHAPTGATTVSASTYDPFAPEVIADPYPWYRQLLDTNGAWLVARHHLWVLARHRDVRRAVRAHDVLSSAEGVAYQRMALPMMLTMDPPDHTRLRRIVARDFTPRALTAWEPGIERLALAAVEESLGAGPVDVVHTLSGPLPVMVIANVLGIPSEDHTSFRSWSDEVVEGFRIGSGVEEPDPSRVLEPVLQLQSYLDALVEERRRDPRDDLVTKLLEPSEEGVLSDSELFWFLFLLLVAGNETTTSLLGNMLLAFAEYPEQWALLRERPELAASAVEETLRFDAPVQGFFRTATAPYEVGGSTVPSGARVLLLFGAANRDPDVCESPDTFRIDRTPTEHLAFGGGIHACLGAALARLEATVALRILAEHVAEIRLSGTPERTANPTLRGVARLPLELIQR